MQSSPPSDKIEVDDGNSSVDDESMNDNDEREQLLQTRSMDDDDDDDDDDDASTTDSTSFLSDLVTASWREHSIAVVIALVATLVAYYLQQRHVASTPEDPALERRRHLLAPTLHHSAPSFLQETVPHRAAHWQCACDDTTTTKTVPKGLQYMTVRIPPHLDAAVERLLPWPLPACYTTDRRLQIPYYQSPSIDSMYPREVAAAIQQQQRDAATATHVSSGTSSSRTILSPAHLTFTGFAAQFVNLSPDPVLLFWERGMDRTLVAELGPFHRVTTATSNGASFSISPVHDPSTAFARWVVTGQDAIQYYNTVDDPARERMQATLDATSQLPTTQYDHALLHQVVAHDYWIHARRPYLAHLPRPLPAQPLRPATYIGQTHTVTYTTTDAKQLQKRFVYTLRVVSVVPRVFVIENFLTADECGELVGDQDAPTPTTMSTVSSTLTHSIYNRTSRLLQLPHDDDDDDEWHHHRFEPLQLLDGEGDEDGSRPQHDWIVPPDGALHPHQPTRFASLRITLSDKDKNSIVFPKAVTKDHHDGVTVSGLAAGTAVLWYNVLPDGNVDDTATYTTTSSSSSSTALHVWVWDPYVA